MPPEGTPKSIPASEEISALKRQLAALQAKLAHGTEGQEDAFGPLADLTDAFLVMDREWRFTYLNAEAERLLARPKGSLLGRVAWEAFPEGAGSIFQQQYELALRERRTVSFEAPYAPIGRWLQITAFPSNGGVAVLFQDISDRHREEAFQRRRADLLELIATGVPVQEVLDAAVGMIEADHDDVMGSILLLSEDGRRVKHGSAPRLPEAYLRAIDGAEIGPAAGSCGTAAYEKRPVVVADIATDPLWASYRHLALPHGLRACWSQPIFARSGEVLGTFALYFKAPKAPEPGDMDQMDSLAKVVGIALERHRTERQLHLLQATVARLNDMLLITEAEPIEAPGPRIQFVNEAFVKRTGYSREEALGQSPRMLQGPATSREALDRIRAALAAKEPLRVELINYTKAGEPFWTDIALAPVMDDDGHHTHWAAIERDITERKRVEEVHLGIVQLQRELDAGAYAPQEAMDLMAERVMALFQADGVVLEVMDGEDLVYQSVAGCLAPHKGRRFSRAGSLSGLVLTEGETKHTGDVSSDPRVDRAFNQSLGARSLVAAPLFSGGTPIGVLKVVATRTDAFSSDDADHLQVLSESLGAGLHRIRLTGQIQASEVQYRLLFRGNPIPMWVYEPGSLQILAANDAAMRQYGYDEAAFLLLTLRDLVMEPGRVEALAAQPLSGRNGPFLSRHRLRDGSVIPVEITGDDLVFEGRPARIIAAADVSARVQAEAETRRYSRAQRLLSACNEALIRAVDETALLNEICRIGVEIGGYRMAWVAFAREDAGKTMAPVAMAGEGASYFDGIRISWDESVPEGHGPSGRCIRSGKVTLVPDFQEDPAFAPWRARAASHGLRGGINLPLKADGRTFGILGFYAGEVMALTEDELALLQELADDLAFGLLHLRREAERGRLQGALAQIGESVSRSTGEAFFDQLAKGMASALGADAAIVTQLLPDSPEKGRVMAGVMDGARIEPFEYGIQGSPCEQLERSESAVVPSGAADLYPGAPFLAKSGAQAYVGQRLENAAGLPIGQLIVLFRKPLQDTSLILATMRIFGSRAATEMGRMEADARIREQASLLDETQEAILVRGLDHRVHYWNRGAERLYGWSASEAMGRSVEALFYEDSTAFLGAFDTLLAKGEWSGELAQRRKDGATITVEGHWTLVRDEQGQPRSILAINSDITARLELEGKLRQSQRLEVVGQLTGGVAHDFNNLLTVILGSSDLLAEELKGDPRLLRLAESCRAAAENGAELTKRLLAFARKQALRPRPLDINQLVAGMDGMLRRTLGEDIEVEYVRGAGLWAAVADPSLLENAVLNLCINARDAMPKGGRLTIETANAAIDRAYADLHPELEPGQYALVAVSDTGVGISPENLAKVFEPFFTTKESGKGTGLGLSMVYGFVKQSKGHVSVYSEPGQGTTVRIYLPRAHESAAAQPERARQVGHYRGTEKILLVEDNDLVRNAAEEQLRALGYQITVASSGPEALSILRREGGFALLFTDVVMPGGMSGRDLAEEALRLHPDMKVLYTSGYTGNAIVHHGRLDPGVHLLNKPYRQVDLARKLREVLDAKS